MSTSASGIASPSPIDDALRQFEAAEANLVKLERLGAELAGLVPQGISFVPNVEHERRAYAYGRLVDSLPKIDGWKIDALPLDLDAVARQRLDAMECDEIDVEIAVERRIDEPGRQLRDYRRRFDAKRRELVRSAVLERIAHVDALLRGLVASAEKLATGSQPRDLSEWTQLQAAVKEIDTLLGSQVSRPPAWRVLDRHLRYGERVDLTDIVETDWPPVKSAIVGALYADDDPVPVSVDDIGDLVRSHPSGVVSTGLRWAQLDAEQFERLVFVLLSSTVGYENPSWVMRTNAPDGGRDLSVERVVPDRLGGTSRKRVIVQCKHWLSRSVGPTDVGDAALLCKLWEPPRVDALVVATSGRFTKDAVAWIEKHNLGDHSLTIEMWPESHLERLLAARPDIVANFCLHAQRGGTLTDRVAPP